MRDVHVFDLLGRFSRAFPFPSELIKTVPDADLEIGLPDVFEGPHAVGGLILVLGPFLPVLFGGQKANGDFQGKIYRMFFSLWNATTIKLNKEVALNSDLNLNLILLFIRWRVSSF